MNFATLLATTSTATSWEDLQTAITGLINSMWLPILAIMGALGVLFAIIIGWSFWSAGGDETKVQKAKANVKWYVIGWFALFIVAFGTPILVSILTNWVNNGGAF